MSTTPASVERYRQAQAAVLDGIGTPVTSSTVPMPSPFGAAHVLEAGSGDPLLLMHGGGVVAQWAPLIPLLAPHFHLLMPDKPGSGLAGPFDYRGVDLRAHGVAFMEALLDAVGLQRAAIGGNSMGGYFAFCFALAHPERVSKLVIFGEPAGADPASSSLYHRMVGTRGLNAFLFKTNAGKLSIVAGHWVGDECDVVVHCGGCLLAGVAFGGVGRLRAFHCAG